MKEGDTVIIKATGDKAVIGYASKALQEPFYLLLVNGSPVYDENNSNKEFSSNELKPYDALIEFLDNNPNDTPEPTTKVLTYEQQMALYHEGYTDCERDNHINN